MEPTPPSETPVVYTCEFDHTELKLIRAILGEVPAKISLPLIQKISKLIGE